MRHAFISVIPSAPPKSDPDLPPWTTMIDDVFRCDFTHNLDFRLRRQNCTEKSFVSYPEMVYSFWVCALLRVIYFKQKRTLWELSCFQHAIN